MTGGCILRVFSRIQKTDIQVLNWTYTHVRTRIGNFVMYFFLFLFFMLLFFRRGCIYQSEQCPIFEFIRRYIVNHSFQIAAQFFTLRHAEPFKHTHIQSIERRPAFPGKTKSLFRNRNPVVPQIIFIWDFFEQTRFLHPLNRGCNGRCGYLECLRKF